MPLIGEVLVNGRWVEILRHQPYDRPGSISNHNHELRRREILIIEADSTCATISRPGVSIDLAVAGSELRTVATSGESEVVARLRRGETHEMDLQTDRMTQPVKARFRFE